MYQPSPNAALLIDFDNVTMSIRSDLGKELRTLLNSEVIRGKVAVQRAYADWRRYPQYIVPLAENSVDLIFAPAYGSSKKNATDLRMAIDAMELVFTRPEIGTYILMTGDSDFSSCVLKLKEYGKYVIGVGMRESSSDLLIQNCDEYYSYHSLSGLTRAGEVQESKEDPWVLTKRAVQQMVKNGDVMRTDRLKQVMLDLDPAFDEKKIGYSKFSRFVSEASSKGIIKLRKGENGQYEILAEGAAEESKPKSKPARSEDSSSDKDKAKETREKVVERIVAEAEAENGRRKGRRGGGRDRSGDTSEAPSAPASSGNGASAEKAAEPTGDVKVDDLNGAYALLQEAVRRLGGTTNKGIRDGDVKRRMLEIASDFDESNLGFPKFTRFLRQAHEDDIIDLNRMSGGNYEVSLSSDGKKLPPPKVAEGAGSKAEAKAPESVAEPEKKEEKKEETKAADTGRSGGVRGRRGARSDAPPPILPGQGVPSKSAKAETEEKATEAKAEEKKPKSRRGSRSKSKKTETKKTDTAKASTKTEKAPAEEKSKAAVSRSRRGRRAGAKDEGPPPILEGQAAGKTSASSGSDLPTTEAGIRAHLAGYKGVGAKTIDSLMEAFGTDVFSALSDKSDEVESLLGNRRSKTLLDQFRAEQGDGASASKSSSSSKRGGSRRGGRSRTRKKEPAKSS